LECTNLAMEKLVWNEKYLLVGGKEVLYLGKKNIKNYLKAKNLIFIPNEVDNC
jgi:hypothetical protein